MREQWRCQLCDGTNDREDGPVCQDCGADNLFPIGDIVAVVDERNRYRLALEKIALGTFVNKGQTRVNLRAALAREIAVRALDAAPFDEQPTPDAAGFRARGSRRDG